MAKKKEGKKARAQKKEAKLELTAQKEESKSNKPNYDKQLKWIVGILAVAVAAIIAIIIIANASNKFEYLGLTFERVKESNLLIYTTNINILKAGGVYDTQMFYFRKDPRKLRNIPIEGEIEIPQAGTTYISVDKGIEGCEYTLVALSNLARFIGKLNTNVVAAMSDKALAEENNEIYKNCASDIGDHDVIIVIEKGEENSIAKIKRGCYKVTFKECEILEATERFTIGTIAHRMGNYDL